MSTYAIIQHYDRLVLIEVTKRTEMRVYGHTLKDDGSRLNVDALGYLSGCVLSGEGGRKGASKAGYCDHLKALGFTDDLALAVALMAAHGPQMKAAQDTYTEGWRRAREIQKAAEEGHQLAKFRVFAAIERSLPGKTGG
jgi:hypothetical protein